MIEITTVSDTRDLEQILELQQCNLIKNIDENEMREQGFVTLTHSLDDLQKMHNLAPSIIAKSEGKVVGYALMMAKEAREICPLLEPMFSKLNSLSYKGKPLGYTNYYVMGQVCIDKDFRGQKIFDRLYEKHRELYSPQFDLLITEVATRNTRSVRAHERVGFKSINIYRDELDEWSVIVWDWNE